jgi:hypothetical protein
LKSSPASFRKIYPKVDASKQHLMKDAVSQQGNHRELKDGDVNGGAGAGAGGGEGTPVVRDQNDILVQLMKDNPKMSTEEAVEKAYVEQQKDIQKAKKFNGAQN